MSKKEDSVGLLEVILGLIIGIIAAIFLGLLAIALFGGSTKSKCPNCGKPVDNNAPYCQSCHAVLRWQ